jgi:hypothetical protein
MGGSRNRLLIRQVGETRSSSIADPSQWRSPHAGELAVNQSDPDHRQRKQPGGS